MDKVVSELGSEEADLPLWRKQALPGEAAIDDVWFYVKSLSESRLPTPACTADPKSCQDVLSKPPDFKRSSIVGFFRATVLTSIDCGLSVQGVALVLGSQENWDRASGWATALGLWWYAIVTR